MTNKILRFVLVLMVFLTAACVKETYDMNKLSSKAHLTPSIVISAINGKILFSDMVKSGDTVVFDQNNFVKVIFRKDSVIDLHLADFIPFKGSVDSNNPYYSKGPLSAPFDPQTIDLGIEDLLNQITGTLSISNPSIKLIYTNSFRDPMQVTFNASGKRKSQTVNLDLAPFILDYPQTPGIISVSSFKKIDKSNSALPALISLPPEVITFSGSASINPSGALPTTQERFFASLEIEIPIEFRSNNLQFADTIDNFMKDDSGDSPFKIENFGLLRVDLKAANGFPLGISIKMSLYDSVTKTKKATVDATDLLKPATVDNTGKVSGATESNTSIEFNTDFFKSVNKADKIIFSFALNTTDSGTKDVKIYSDYSIDFSAALVVRPDINLK